ncbi:hypothetical protein ACFV4G_43350 [Kitasatospora sp. NPDC059747]|uniref:hypothetical protein n=1 Tax=Kitasatospora sp. NPDC059747 TaxID=3346930 RepID=UPI0036691185
MNSPDSESFTLYAHASALEQQKALLPAAGFPVQVPDPVALRRQIARLGALITAMGNEFTARAAEQPAPEHALRAAGAYAAAIGHVGQAAADLGTVAQQLAFFGRTADTRDDPEVRKARQNAAGVIGWAIETARDELDQGAATLRQTASVVAPPSQRVQAALSRSTTAVTVSARTAPSTAPPLAPPAFSSARFR